MNVSELRLKHPEIVYRNFSWTLNTSLHIKFEFFIAPDLVFKPAIEITFPPTLNPQSTPKELVDNLVFHLGLIELFSYWKLVAAPTIRIEAGYLSDIEVGWWHELLMRGMGEYFYKNQIDFTQPNFVNWSIKSDHTFTPQRVFCKEQYLTLTSGGKDSLLARQILGELGKEVVPFREYTLIDDELDPSKIAGDGITAFRRLDPLLMKLNKTGYLNGHVPYSAYLSFLSLVVAGIIRSKYIAVGNEKSANEANVTYLGKPINHQYSKSFQFEKDFRAYVNSYITPDISYFSIMRPLYELQIAQLLAAYPEHLTRFTSCNRFRSSGSWCGECPKCVSIFLLIAPFVGVPKTTTIFGKNMLVDSSLLPLFKSMLDEKETKPFECVATHEETQIAAYLILQTYEKSADLPALINYFKEEMYPAVSDWEEKSQVLLSQYDTEHFLSSELSTALKTKIEHANR